MTNIQFAPIATIRWALHTRLIPAYCYQQILTVLYFIHAFIPSKVQTYMNVATESSWAIYASLFQPLLQHTTIKALLFLAALPLLSFISMIGLGFFAVFWPLLIVGTSCSVVSFTSALLTLNSEQINSSPMKHFALYLFTLIPVAGLTYLFSPILMCTLFVITAYHSITNPHFSSIPSLSTAGSRWLGVGCALLLITAPYWTVWHIVSFPLCFFCSWMAQFWTFVGCNLISRIAPHAVDSLFESYSNFVGKHSRSISVEKDHIIMEKTNANGNGRETYERMQKIEHHS